MVLVLGIFLFAWFPTVPYIFIGASYVCDTVTLELMLHELRNDSLSLQVQINLLPESLFHGIEVWGDGL